MGVRLVIMRERLVLGGREMHQVREGSVDAVQAKLVCHLLLLVD